MKYLIFSIDVEPDYKIDKTIITYNHIKENLIPLLRNLKNKNITATLFIPAIILKDNKDLLQEFFKDFEFALKTKPELDFKSKTKILLTSLSKQEQFKIIKESKEIIESIINEKVISFRASNHKINSDTLEILDSLNFQADSSFLSFITENKHIIKPYKIKNITEYPITASYNFPLLFKIPMKLRNLILNKNSSISFTGHTLSKPFSYYLINYAINDLFKNNDILSIYLHSYELANAKTLNTLNSLLSKHKKDYIVISIKDSLKYIKNDSPSKSL